MESYGLILLAAGASSRMGEPKQLLRFKESTLVEKAIHTAAEVIRGPIVVVLGAHAGLIEGAIKHLPVHRIGNENWKEGMASSIRCGLSAITTLSPTIDNVIIMVCDQPFVTPSVIEHLIRRHEESSKNIVASAYANTLGIPVLFNKEVFADLMKLQGAEGAKRIITHHPEKVDSVVFPLGSVDIDTKDDYRSLLA